MLLVLMSTDDLCLISGLCVSGPGARFGARPGCRVCGEGEAGLAGKGIVLFHHGPAEPGTLRSVLVVFTHWVDLHFSVKGMTLGKS